MDTIILTVNRSLNCDPVPSAELNENGAPLAQRPTTPSANSSNEIEEGELPAEENAKPAEFEMQTDTGGQQLEVANSPQIVFSPRKPVLGKEKAKQRLKALGIQKKIQMESRINTTPKKPKSKSSTESSAGSSNGGAKKDRKLLSPHEKAQLTIKEIEVMKREEERVKIPIYYNEAMIHRITVDSYDSNKSSTSQPTVTPSLEAIKCYEDEDNRDGGAMVAERRHKRAKPEAYRRRRRSTSSPFSSKGKLKPRRERRGSSQRDSSDSRRLKREIRRSQDQRPQNRPSTEDGQAERQSRQLSFIVRPSIGFRPEEFYQTDLIRYTRTKPVISFACNSLARGFKKKLKSKSRKKSKKKRSVPAETSEKSSEKEKRPKKKKRSSRSKDGEDLSLSSKKSKKKSKQSAQEKGPKMGMLSFAAEDFNFEEDIDEFPIAKEESRELSQTEESTSNAVSSSKDSPLLSSLIPVAGVSSNVDDNSPDTDDYLPNWEEEDEDSSKDEIPTSFPLRKGEDQMGVFVPDCPSSSPQSASGDSNSESVKDGLGTPIFVNPSPPDEIVESMVACDFDEDKRLSCDFFELPKDSRPVGHERLQQVVSDEESLTPPPQKSKHLFEMENIYEQFLQSVREDPDFKSGKTAEVSSETSDISKLTIENPNNSTDEDESGFLSQSAPATRSPSSTSTSSHSPSSNSSSSKSNDTSDTDSTGKGSIMGDTHRKKKRKRKRVKSPSEPAEQQTIAGSVDDEDATSDTDELSDITSEDLKKLRSLQKRRGMLKMIRQQIDGMDEEDRQCLLGLEKLIRAERHMLLRNQAIRRLHLRKKILGTDSEDSKDEESTKSNDSEPVTPPSQASDINGIIFDAKREAIKMTITNKNSSPMKKLHTTPTKPGAMQDNAIPDDDQDFTERLMKPKGSSKSRCSPTKLDERSDDQRKSKSSERCERSLSLSPTRRSRTSPSRDRSKGRSKKRDYSPASSRNSSRRHKDKTNSRIHRPRRFSRSPPPYRSVPSPSHSRSSSRSPSPSPPQQKKDVDSPHRLQAAELYPTWNIERYSQYYIAESYYYPRVMSMNGSDDKAENNQPRYPNSYDDYSQYNAIYANEYMNSPINYPSGYSEQSEYPELSRSTNATANESNSYLSIPVIGSSDNYIFKREFDNASNSLPSLKIAITGQQNTEILHHDEAKIAPTKPFAVQKGNVLEIVPAATISSVMTEVAPVATAPPISDIKQEPVENDLEPQETPSVEESKEENKTDVKSSLKKGHSWRNEVARRHVVSAVMRLNKETEDSPRGILKSKGNSTISAKEKKKVLFADGIPPGRTSSASSDEEATLKFIRKRLKKKQRRMMSENKENELLAEADVTTTTVEAKIDPELWDAPPPPPPPGSPPAHLPQPILIRPASPEELLYFHFDPVYNMMYVSPMENAIPPRLLQNNGKSTIKVNIDSLPAENGDTTIDGSQPNKTAASMQNNDNPGANSPSNKDDTTVNCSATEDAEEVDEKQLGTPTELKKAEAPLPPSSTEQRDEATPPSNVPLQPIGSPPQPIQNIVSMRMNSNSPLPYNQGPQVTAQCLPSSYESPQSQSPQPMSSQSPSAHPPIPIMVGYPGQIFNRMQSRRPSPNIVRGPYNMPPPSTLHNRAFNPHIPPPFPTPPPSANGPIHPTGYDTPGGPGNLPSSQPPPFNPNMMMYNSPSQPQQLPSPHSHPMGLPPRPQSFNYGGPTPPPPHMMMNRMPNCFSTIPPPPVAMANFIHGGGLDRTGSPRVGSPRHLFRVPPPQQQQPQQLPPQQPPTTPPGTPYI